MKTNKPNKEKSVEVREVLDRIPAADRKKISNKMYLAARLDDLLVAKGWNKSTFAEKMGKRPSEISKWLSGTHNFTMDTLTDIAHFLEVDFASLFAENPVTSRPKMAVPRLRGKRALDSRL